MSDELRLEQLVSEKCNGSLGPEGYAELHALLGKSAELRSAYWAMIAIHGDLEWNIAGEESFSNEQARLVLTDSEQDSATIIASRERSVGSASRWKWNAAIAAGLVAVLLSAWSLWYLREEELSDRLVESAQLSSEQAPAVAQLTALAADSRWSFGRPGDRNPKDLHLGDTVWVEEGMVEMRLDDSTVGELRAPAILQLLTENRVRLLHGNLKVYALARAQGFTVETPCAEIVDLGTVFSVGAADTGTDLVVFDGKVDLKIPSKVLKGSLSPATTRQFTTGQAVRVNLNGTLSRIMQVQSSAYPLASNTPSWSPVITSVKDNIVRDDHWAFYEIVRGGMREDARAYVDRFHEWNGATQSGMPSYLVGGDYVKMFNDDKITKDLVIEVTVSQPAVLYVLLDNRVAPPEWLTKSFSESGDVIGIDETPHDPVNRVAGNEDFSQVGPGESIDRTHTIWKRVMPEGGTVRLGPNGHPLSQEAWNKRVRGPRGWRANMYGIVAVPLEQTEK